jgi:hypothetical protein
VTPLQGFHRVGSVFRWIRESGELLLRTGNGSKGQHSRKLRRNRGAVPQCTLEDELLDKYTRTRGHGSDACVEIALLKRYRRISNLDESLALTAARSWRVKMVLSRVGESPSALHFCASHTIKH